MNTIFEGENKICCIFIFGSFYRKAIYHKMAKEMNCDFYFGNRIQGEIKELDIESLRGFKKHLKNIWFFGRIYWQGGAVRLIFKSYHKYILTGDPDCLSNWILLILAKILGKKTYLWTHGWYGRESFLKKYLKKAFFNLSYHVFLYGDYARDLMVKEGFSPLKLSCIYNSMDFENQIALREQLRPSSIFKKHFKNENYNLIFIGRLTSIKRIDLLIMALVILNSNCYHSNLIIIGTGEAHEELRRLSLEKGISKNIWFYGECYDEVELSELIFNADLCVSPGNVGLTAIHSMVYGTPVVTHNDFRYQGPEFEAIQDGITGTFFEYGSSLSLSNKIIEWFSHSGDRNIIRRNCYEVIDTKYNPHYQIEILKEKILL